MMVNRVLVRVLVGVALVTGTWGLMQRAVGDEKKAEPDKKSGKVEGVVTAKAKDSTSIEVKADGEEKARRYVPHWRGGAPAAGGGPDKKVVEQLSKIEVGSRVRLEWEYEERYRVVKIEVVKAPKKDK